MATPTYTLIDSTVLGSAASSVTFSSITQDYRDLRIVVDCKSATGSGAAGVALEFNGDTGANYSFVAMRGDGSTATSTTSSGDNYLQIWYGVLINETDSGLYLADIMDYSATDKHKSALGRANQVSDEVSAAAGRWANTSAITSLTVRATNPLDEFAAGSTFYLYGIGA